MGQIWEFLKQIGTTMWWERVLKSQYYVLALRVSGLSAVFVLIIIIYFLNYNFFLAWCFVAKFLQKFKYLRNCTFFSLCWMIRIIYLLKLCLIRNIMSSGNYNLISKYKAYFVVFCMSCPDCCLYLTSWNLEVNGKN